MSEKDTNRKLSIDVHSSNFYESNTNFRYSFSNSNEDILILTKEESEERINYILSTVGIMLSMFSMILAFYTYFVLTFKFDLIIVLPFIPRSNGKIIL